jgi:signal peptidase II
MAQKIARASGFALAAVSLAADQSAKLAALTWLEHGVVLSPLPFLNLRLGFNTGVSFGLGANLFAGSSAVLLTATLAIAAGLAVWLWRAGTCAMALALGAILGGALGNILDRARLGVVVDFIDLHAWDYHWPAFNVADIAIVCGAIGLIAADFMRDAQR